MGCYGIGVTRIVAAAIEQNHDDNGIIWPDADRAVPGRASCPIGYRQERRACAKPPTSCTHELRAAGIEVLLDDRDERPGVMFADMELIGIPHRIVVGDQGLAEGQFEYKHRRDDKPHMIAATAAAVLELLR